MKRLRIMLVGALLTLPLLSLNASPSVDTGDTATLEQTQRVTGTCWVFYNGKWWSYPC